MGTDIADVKSFWNSTPCQSELSQHRERRQYFEEISRKRFGGREWHVPTVAKFDSFAGKDLLEIGCGVGTDGIEFARNNGPRPTTAATVEGAPRCRRSKFRDTTSASTPPDDKKSGTREKCAVRCLVNLPTKFLPLILIADVSRFFCSPPSPYGILASRRCRADAGANE